MTLWPSACPADFEIRIRPGNVFTVSFIQFWWSRAYCSLFLSLTDWSGLQCYCNPSASKFGAFRDALLQTTVANSCYSSMFGLFVRLSKSVHSLLNLPTEMLLTGYLWFKRTILCTAWKSQLSRCSEMLEPSCLAPHTVNVTPRLSILTFGRTTTKSIHHVCMLYIGFSHMIRCLQEQAIYSYLMSRWT